MSKLEPGDRIKPSGLQASFWPTARGTIKAPVAGRPNVYIVDWDFAYTDGRYTVNSQWHESNLERIQESETKNPVAVTSPPCNCSASDLFWKGHGSRCKVFNTTRKGKRASIL